jgi:putative ABC transport system permease protein
MLRHLPLVLHNCWRNRRRTILTVLSVGVSLCLLGVLMAIYHAFYLSNPNEYSARRLVTRSKVSLGVPLPLFYGQKIKQIPGVQEVGPEQWFGGVYIDDKHFFARFAVQPDKILAVRPEMTIPEDQKKAFLSERTACIAGRALAEKYNWHLGERIPIKGDIFPVNLELTLRGIYDAPISDDVLYFNWEYLQQGLPQNRRGMVGTFWSRVNSTEDVPRVEKAVDEMFRDSPAQTKTETESAFGLSFVAFLGNVKLFLLSICGAVTFTILLVSGNTIAMSARERVREVGVLKTLGYTRGTILGIILGEAVTVCLIGGILGLLLAQGLVIVVRHGPTFAEEIRYLTIVPPVAAACLALAATIGLVSAFVPAYGASRVSIVEALRSTE